MEVFYAQKVTQNLNGNMKYSQLESWTGKIGAVLKSGKRIIGILNVGGVEMVGCGCGCGMVG